MLPADICDLSSVDVMIDENLELCSAREAGRCQLVEVFRFLSEAFRFPDTTAATLYEEVQRCHTAIDIGNVRLSKAVLLQQEALADQRVVDIEVLAAILAKPISEDATTLHHQLCSNLAVRGNFARKFRQQQGSYSL